MNANPKLCPEFPVHPALAAASAEIASAVPRRLFEKGKMTARRWRLPQRRV